MRKDGIETCVAWAREDENGKPRNWKEELFSINREISLVCHSITFPDTYPVTHSCTLEEYHKNSSTWLRPQNLQFA